MCVNVLGVEVKDAWKKLVRMYSEYRRKLVSATTSGSGAARQPHPHQDLMDKLSFLSDKSSNRKGKSSLVVSKKKNLSELDKIVEQKEAAGIIVSEPNRFCRMKKSNNTDDSFKSELTAMSSAIKDCAQNFSDRLMKHNQQANAAEPYQKPILKYFEKIEEEEKKDTLMKEMLAVIIQYPQKPQQ